MTVRDDYTIDQGWEAYTAEEHAVWRTLFQRQAKLLPGRATPAFLDGLDDLLMAADGIPDFRRLSDTLGRRTGWEIVAVPGLVPDAVFFEHLANRRFPAANWVRKLEEMDYLEEPDVFHDVFGHVPLLINPIFADYMEAYGKAGLAALDQGALHHLARLYWYTVEFGLIETPEGLQIYGAGIVSSKGESIFCLDDRSPNRVGFDLARVMQTRYRIDDYQETYFVVDGFETLFEIADRDLSALYRSLAEKPDLEPGDLLPDDRILTRGTGLYHAAKRAA